MLEDLIRMIEDEVEIKRQEMIDSDASLKKIFEYHESLRLLRLILLKEKAFLQKEIKSHGADLVQIKMEEEPDSELF